MWTTQDDPPQGRNITRAGLSSADIAEFLVREFPQCKCRVLEVGPGTASIAHEVGLDELRPGGTVSGPVLMTVADVGLYVALLGEIGIVPLAVTTNLTINFLKKPAPRDLLAEARLIKLGKRLAVGEIGIRSDGEDDLVAHVTSTYSIPA